MVKFELIALAMHMILLLFAFASALSNILGDAAPL